MELAAVGTAAGDERQRLGLLPDGEDLLTGLGQMAIVLALWAGGNNVLSGEGMTVGEVSTFTQYMGLIITPLALLARRHRVLLVALRDESFGALDASEASGAGDAGDLYRRIVLDDLLREREETLSRLRQRGLHTLDLVSQEVTAPVLNHYLALRYSGET